MLDTKEKYGVIPIKVSLMYSHTYNRKRVTNELTWTGTQKPGLPEKLSPVREILD
jgi:hypothetical protein